MTSTPTHDLSASPHDRQEDEPFLWPLLRVDLDMHDLPVALLVTARHERIPVMVMNQPGFVGPVLHRDHLPLTADQIEHLRTLNELAQVDPGFTPVILPLSPPCESFSHPGRVETGRRERLGLPSIESLLRIQFRDDAPTAVTQDIIPLPPREKPRGRGRTSIPKTQDRRDELAARAARLRNRNTKAKTR